MQWFKHMTNSRHNKHIRAIYKRWGSMGVLRYYWLIEVIAEPLGDDDEPELAAIPEFWCNELRFRSRTDARAFLEWLAKDRGMVTVQSRNVPGKVRERSGNVPGPSLDLVANEWCVRCEKINDIRNRKKVYPANIDKSKNKNKSKTEHPPKNLKGPDKETGPDPKKEARLWWDQIMLWIRKGCPANQKPHHDNDRVKSLLRELGGVANLRRKTVKDLEFIGNDFVNRFSGVK